MAYFKGASKWVPQGTVGVGIGGTPFDQWPEEVRKGYMYDPEAAEALLDEVGLPRGADGTRFEIPLQHYEFFDVDYVQLAAAYWKEIGVDVQIDVTERSEHMARIRERGFEGMVSSISGIAYLSPLVAIGSNYSQSQSDLGVDRAHLAGDLGTAFTFDGRQIVLPWRSSQNRGL